VSWRASEGLSRRGAENVEKKRRGYGFLGGLGVLAREGLRLSLGGGLGDGLKAEELCLAKNAKKSKKLM
jgi:hypothetical protein